MQQERKLGSVVALGGRPNPLWDYGFLASCPLLITIGWMLARRAGEAAADAQLS